jgi:hypothetical protein
MPLQVRTRTTAQKLRRFRLFEAFEKVAKRTRWPNFDFLHAIGLRYSGRTRLIFMFGLFRRWAPGLAAVRRERGCPTRKFAERSNAGGRTAFVSFQHPPLGVTSDAVFPDV